LLTLIEHMRDVKFVPPSLGINFLVSKNVEDILPKMQEAARKVAEAEKTMAVPAERL
jgi:hypothetical protein